MKVITTEMLKTLTIDDVVELYRQGYILPLDRGIDSADVNIKMESQINPLNRISQEHIFKRLKDTIIENCTKKLNKSLGELNKSLSEPETMKTVKDTISECLSNPARNINASYMSDEDDAYDILGLSSDSTNSQIKKRYKELSREYHPDKLHTTDSIKNLANEKFKQINCAFEFIKKRRNFQ